MTQELLDLARSIAVEAGELARRRRAAGVEVAASKSSPVDIVTTADRETEELIRGRIADARPRDGILGEEGGVAAGGAGTSGLTWIVDPIDGTVNYLYGVPHYAVSIAVVEGPADPLRWDAVAGCVVSPANGEVFTASRGGGSFLGERALRVREPVDLSEALISTGFAYAAATREAQGAVIAKLLPRVRDLRRMGVASLDLCAVAAGRTDAYFERTASPWDHAAGVLIAREAGAAVLGRGGRAPDRELVLAAHPLLAERLEDMLVGFGLFDFSI